MDKEKQFIPTILVIVYAILMVIWPSFPPNGGNESLQNSYLIFMLYAGPGLVLPLLLLPAMPSGLVPRKILFVPISMAIYEGLLFFFFSGDDMGMVIFLGCGVLGAAGFSTVYKLMFLPSASEWYILVASFAGLFSFSFSLFGNKELMFLVSVPLWILGVGLSTVYASKERLVRGEEALAE